MITLFLTQGQVDRFSLGGGHRAWGTRVSVWDGARGPRMYLWDRSGCSRVGGRHGARLRGHTDHADPRRDILVQGE